MLNKDDINALDLYFKGLDTIPEGLVKVAQKIDKANIINKAQDDLLELMKDGE